MMRLALLAVLAPFLLAAEAADPATWLIRVTAEANSEAALWRGDDASIRLGAAICFAAHPGAVGHDKGRPAHWPAAVAVFNGFWSTRGPGLLRRLRSGEDLGADARWRPVLEMAWGSVAVKMQRGGPGRLWDPGLSEAEYAAAEADAKALDAAAGTLLRRAYADRSLTADDIAVLRRWQRRMWTKTVGGLVHLPSELRLGGDGSRFAVGAPLAGWQDLRATPLAAALALAEYTDRPDPDAAVLRPLRPDGVLEILRAMAAHRLVEGAALPDPDWLAAQPAAADQVGLDAWRGGRPLMLIAADAADCFIPFAYQQAEALRHAYGDRVAVAMLNLTIHDLHMSPRQFWGDLKTPFVAHPDSLAERARTARNLAMAFPGVGLPWLLDDVGCTVQSRLASHGGAANTRIFDRDGRLHDAIDSPFYGVLWADAVELSLKELLDAGGRTTRSGFVARNPRAGERPLNATARQPPPSPTLLRCSLVVQDVDPAGRAISASGAAAATPLVIRVDSATRVHGSSGPLRFEALEKGARIRVEFDLAAWAGCRPEEIAVDWDKPWVPHAASPCVIRAGAASVAAKAGGGNYGDRGWIHYDVETLSGPASLPAVRVEVLDGQLPCVVWMLGKVAEVDGTTRIVELEQHLAPERWLGSSFWRSAGDARSDQRILSQLAVLDRWALLPDGVRRRVRIDAATRLSLDGVPVEGCASIRPGQRIALAMLPGMEAADPLMAEQVRLASPSPP